MDQIISIGELNQGMRLLTNSCIQTSHAIVTSNRLALHEIKDSSTGKTQDGRLIVKASNVTQALERCSLNIDASLRKLDKDAKNFKTLSQRQVVVLPETVVLPGGSIISPTSPKDEVAQNIEKAINAIQEEVVSTSEKANGVLKSLQDSLAKEVLILY